MPWTWNWPSQNSTVFTNEDGSLRDFAPARAREKKAAMVVGRFYIIIMLRGRLGLPEGSVQRAQVQINDTDEDLVYVTIPASMWEDAPITLAYENFNLVGEHMDLS